MFLISALSTSVWAITLGFFLGFFNIAWTSSWDNLYLSLYLFTFSGLGASAVVVEKHFLLRVGTDIIWEQNCVFLALTVNENLINLCIDNFSFEIDILFFTFELDFLNMSNAARPDEKSKKNKNKKKKNPETNAESSLGGLSSALNSNMFNQLNALMSQEIPVDFEKFDEHEKRVRTEIEQIQEIMNNIQANKFDSFPDEPKKGKS